MDRYKILISERTLENLKKEGISVVDVTKELVDVYYKVNQTINENKKAEIIEYTARECETGGEFEGFYEFISHLCNEELEKINQTTKWLNIHSNTKTADFIGSLKSNASTKIVLHFTDLEIEED